MHWTGINYAAVLPAAAVAWLAGAVWYGVLFGKPWIAANGITPEQMAANKGKLTAFLPFVYSFLANLVMAIVLAGVMMHAGPFTVKNGLISGAMCWAGFVMTTMIVNNSFAMRRPRLLLIDGGHWLVVLLLMGAVIGMIGR